MFFFFLDFNNDNIIKRDDIEEATKALTNNSLKQDEIDVVVEKVLDEADIDGRHDECITSGDFHHIISRAPDFLTFVTLLTFVS